ncbi:hypothetical protein A2Y85_01435 [candidate division WOR-3 bacterium RBG_13_43_14]|uniref:DNA-binding response regulator n=1 Tax=candidate division WOR-3 bacterium RBG_13_43_14 TaxID=1802590 RepID=A0A1F4U6E3_UNCW3|nr:MAG: hypothetical protein A2Y85_01435 [candidate division WOR-3 bacterium RBG_13_43_14]
MYRFFIADDHTMVRSGLKRILEEKKDFKVIGETGDGLEIAPKIRQLKPDILIIDISMPNLRGIEAIRKIRKFDKKVKIIVLTMHKNNDYVYECLSSGAQGFILKDDADTELHKAIDEVQHDRLYVSSSFSNEVIRNLIQRAGTRDRSSRSSIFKTLTAREREILKVIAEGNTNKKTAAKLGISVRTVEHHRLCIMKKLKITTTVNLIKYAIKADLINLT